MKHLVLIAGIVHPAPSPTGRCALDYVGLLSDEYSIDVVYMSANLHDVSPHENQGMIFNPCRNWRHVLEQRHMANSKSRRFSRFLVKLAKGFGRIQSLLFYPNNLYWFVSSATRQLELIHQNNPIDVVFSVSSPFAAHLAAARFKKGHPDILWAAYTVDPYSTLSGIKPLWLSKQGAALREKRLLAEADRLFLSEELMQARPDLISNKGVALPYLMQDLHTIDNIPPHAPHFDKEHIHLLYAGSFYNQLRNPENMLKTFHSLRQTKIILHLFHTGGCDDIVKRYVEMPNSNTILHAPIKFEELREVYHDADVLVSLGNKDPEFSPSKVFEYVSTGKPIVHFYYAAHRDKTLDQYPMTLQIENDGYLENHVKNISDFIDEFAGKRVDKNEIAQIYYNNSPQTLFGILEKGLKVK